MNIYENVATESIASIFHNDAKWKKELLFDFLLQKFNLNLSDVADLTTQDKVKDTIPDFTIATKDGQSIRFEVKINDAKLTFSEKDEKSRDAFLVRKSYAELGEIPKKAKILFWEDLFDIIDKKGATSEFERLALIREYMREDIHTLLLSPHEVAMFYSPSTVKAIYTMSNKILGLCQNFLNSHEKEYEFDKSQQDCDGIGYVLKEKKGKKRKFFIGLDLTVDENNWAVGLAVGQDMYDNYTLDKEILAKCTSEEELQEQFNKNVEEVIVGIK